MQACKEWLIGQQLEVMAPTRLIARYWRAGRCQQIPWINTLRPRQNGRHFPDNIFKRIFLNENVWISLKISLNFVPRIRINNIPALVLIMAWRRWWLAYWRIYASLSLNELTHWGPDTMAANFLMTILNAFSLMAGSNTDNFLQNNHNSGQLCGVLCEFRVCQCHFYVGSYLAMLLTRPMCTVCICIWFWQNEKRRKWVIYIYHPLQLLHSS